MKKRSLMTALLVGVMLTGCGGAGGTSEAGSSGNAESNVTVETQQSEVSSEVVADVTEIEMQSPEDLPLATDFETAEVVDDGTFYGLEITPSGEEKWTFWHYEKNNGTAEAPDWHSVNQDLLVKAEVTTNVTEDGKYEKTVTYTMKLDNGGEMTGDWVLAILDYATGEDLIDKEGNSAYASGTTLSEDGSQVWSATLVTPEETDSVFLWTQNTAGYEMCYYDSSYLVNADAVNMEEFLSSCKDNAESWCVLTRN